MTQQPQQSQEPKTIPPPPKPRTDLQPMEGETPEEYAEWMEDLAKVPPDAWRDQDGTIYLRRMPASMAPTIGQVDAPTYLAPGSPVYDDRLGDIPPEYDFMEPTPATPEPRTEEETPDAPSPDDDAEA